MPWHNPINPIADWAPCRSSPAPAAQPCQETTENQQEAPAKAPQQREEATEVPSSPSPFLGNMLSDDFK